VPESNVPTAVTETPPRPENPFAIDAIRAASFDDTSQREVVDIPLEQEGLSGQSFPQQHIEYVSATRDLTTIDEGLYFNENRETTRRFQDLFPLAGAYPWDLQKQDAVNTSVDKFRMSMGNFWVFKGESESLYSPIITDPRAATGPQPYLSNNEFDRYRVIQFYSEPAAREQAQFRYIKSDSFIGNPRYTFLEILPFRFRKDILDLEYQLGNYSRFDSLETFDQFTYSALQDMFLEGPESAGFSLLSEDYLSQNSIRRDIFSSENIEYDRNFYDFVFDAPAAFLESEVDKLVVTPSDVANIQVMVQNQEIFQDVESELNLPSIYSFYQSKQLEKAINKDESILEVLRPGQVSFAQQTVANFDELSNSNPFLDSNVHRFPSTKVEKLQEINEVMRASVTNFVEINIKTRQGQPINSLIQENKMDAPLLQILGHMAAPVSNARARTALASSTFQSRQIRRVFTKILDDEFISADSQESLSATVNDKVSSGIGEGVLIYLNEILEDLAHIKNRRNFWPRDLDTYPLYYDGWDREDLLKLEETITSQIFLRKMEQHIARHQLYRRYTDIIHGSKAYAEVIGYKVEKYRITKNDSGQEQERKIQTFLLMDSDKVGDINFLDAQVIPDRKYKYKIFAINFVLGSAYQYSSGPTTQYTWKLRQQNQLIGRNSRNPGSFALTTLSGVVPSIIYSPYFEKTVSLSDKPPIFPQVSFLPYQGIDDVHALLIQSNYGEISVPPIPIFSEDREAIANMYRRQASPPGGNILYKSDSLPNGFEIMRIDTPPESYSDFSDPDTVVVRVPATGKTAYVNLNIQPNKTYYYCFRTYDDGGMSNPTEVFKVRIVSYQNGIFMEVEAYEMRKQQEEYKISFEKLLKIAPSLNQRIINFSKKLKEVNDQEQEGDISELKKLRKELGIRNASTEKEFQRSAPDENMLSIGMPEGRESIWNKKFKIRCISKKTGKKIDLNISFVQGKMVMDTPIESTTKETELELETRQETETSPITTVTPRSSRSRGPSGGGSSY